jgi:hypothetical protein
MTGEEVLGRVVTEVFSPLYMLVASCAFVYFLYGGVKFIIALNDPDQKNKGKQHLLWGTIGLFIIFSVGGILKLFNEVFDGLFTF